MQHSLTRTFFHQTQQWVGRQNVTPLLISRVPRRFSSQNQNSTDGPALVRSPHEIASRAACLQILLARWGMEMAVKMGHGDADTKSKALDNIRQITQDDLVNQNLSAKEMRLLQQEDGSWNREDLDVHGHWESLGILLWTLSRQPTIPPYYEMFSRPKLFNATGVLPAVPQTIHDFIAQANQQKSPRSPHEWHRAIDMAEAWYWRSSAQRLLDAREELGLDHGDANNPHLQASPTMGGEKVHQKIPPSVIKFLKGIPQAIAQASLLAKEQGLITERVEDDFGVESAALYGNLGQPKNIPLNDDSSAMEQPITWLPYRTIDASGLMLLADIAQHRMLAFSWLTGKINNWDEDRTQLQPINPVNSLWAPFLSKEGGNDSAEH
ncbi:hypothetical protein IWQ62_004596 [Dispira parvispora]|uniref:Uncharacterized protein n=1 Tax=Dispira parvispora TaxID=1520584 RepID=A0A9W8E603_9FUNG|nr:hypothetical protein IWQ62_004596 [Dispira parvispora]